MADAELEEIRRARLAQLQQQQGGGAGPRGGPAQGGGQEEQRQAESERRAAIMNQILDPAAADRLGRIRLVKEQRATDIENRLITLAQTGQLRSKVTEEQLKELLNAVAENQRKEEEEQKIVISRRKGGWDDDDDLLDL
ncbi:dsDNA-binding protein PDCD5 [Penicillium cinerascens]|uniref:DsDNA-binding protein PDCD5 n=1 Tax=Penicillium cinerascens TaxID=70096 RepID=A0A9W9JLU8_9EURO|nr:dsDNA-binding protein PDCD5 [Penicillium cinerascens]KAJ5198297.1 dsDNA-binding protein PDCD5 [Penicillium cinerascens]